MSSHQQPGDHRHHHKEIEATILYQGFALFHLRKEKTAELTHTIGLYSAQSPHPELLISGLHRQTRVYWMLSLGFGIKGPPSERALLDEARARGLPLQTIRARYPGGGTRFEPGVVYSLAQGDLPGCFGVVEAGYYEEYLWHATVHHQNTDFPVLQNVWSDPASRFPWEKGYDQERFPQRLFFDPHPLLPLQMGEE